MSMHQTLSQTTSVIFPSPHLGTSLISAEFFAHPRSARQCFTSEAYLSCTVRRVTTLLPPTRISAMSSTSSIQSPAPSTSLTATATPNYAPLVSSQLIGSLLSFFFFGTLVIQVYVYRICFPKDSLFVKSVVYFIFLAMTVCTCLIAADVEAWFGRGFGNIAGLADARNSRFYNPLMGSFIGMFVQLFFSYRILSMKRAAWPFALLVGLLAFAQCAGGMGAGIVSYMDGLEGDAVHDSVGKILVDLWLIGGATVNVLIACTMTILLRAGAVSEDCTCVERAVRMVVESNILSVVAALLGLLLFYASPNTSYWVGPLMILPGIYANTLLVTLNTRAARDAAESNFKTVTFPAASQRVSGTTANSLSPLTRGGAAYSSNGVGRVLSVPAMSFARQKENDKEAESAQEKHLQEPPPRSSVEREWRKGQDADSESEYESDNEHGNNIAFGHDAGAAHAT
ncbi:hypothetical protein B0H12DRAFT_1129992 [Mycena haematopus]|nr:hypothetical protein B0H12DRAFT_1129992 [Mycena haematopus]